MRGAEGQRLTVRPPTDKTDGTNKEAKSQKGSVYQHALKQALGACSEVAWLSLGSSEGTRALDVSNPETEISYVMNFGLPILKERSVLQPKAKDPTRDHGAN